MERLPSGLYSPMYHIGDIKTPEGRLSKFLELFRLHLLETIPKDIRMATNQVTKSNK